MEYHYIYGIGRCFDKGGLYKKGGGDTEAQNVRRIDAPNASCKLASFSNERREAEHFSEVVGVSIVAADCLCSTVDTVAVES